MNQTILLIISVLLLGFVSGWGALHYYAKYGVKEIFCNIAEGEHEGTVTRTAEVAFSTRYLLGKKGTADIDVDICGVADEPFCVVTDEPAIGDDTGCRLLNSAGQTSRMVASEAMTVGDKVYTAASGKTQDEPVAAGTYYRVGVVVGSPAAADGDVMEVEMHAPIKVVVIVTLGNTDNEIGALTIGGTYTQAEVVALRDKCEELADDVRDIAVAFATPAEIKVL